MRFKDKVAIITGASDGIGKATALLLAKEGGKVVINARNQERLQSAAEEITAIGASPITVTGDIGQQSTIDSLVEQTLSHHGRIDILINNAGGGTPIRTLEEITPAEWDLTLTSNLSSIFFCCQKVAAAMKQQRYGRMVNLTSLAGRSRSILAGPQYSASKAGVIGLTRHLAGMLGPFGVTVNAVAPGVTLTERIAKRWITLSTAEQNQILADIPLGRLAQPEEIAPAIAFLASDQAAYITGAVIDVNGGRLMV